MSYDITTSGESNWAWEVKDWKAKEEPRPPRLLPKVDKGVTYEDPTGQYIIKSKVVAGRNTAIVVVYTMTNGGMVYAVGESKRNKNDVHNPTVGASLALGRALVNLGTELERRAMAQVG